MTALLKILLAFALVLAFLLTIQLMTVQSGYVFWEDRKSQEEKRQNEDLSLYNKTFDVWLQRSAEAQAVASGPLQMENVQLKQALESYGYWAQEAEAAKEEIDQAYDQLETGISQATRGIAGRYKDIVENRRAIVEGRLTLKDQAQEQGIELRKELMELRTGYAVDYEDYLVLEYNQYLLQEELQRRNEILYRYRSLRPGLQKKIGDNGAFLPCNVLSVAGLSLVLDKGRDDGLELYQKFSIQRQGRIVALANIVGLSDHNAEAEILALPLKDQDVLPLPGDTALPQRFLLPLSE